MPRIKNIFVFLTIIFSVTAFAAQPVKNLKIVGKIPQGVTVKKNMVTVKKGFEIVKVSDSKVNIMSRRNNNTTGSFECGCSTGGGGCKVVIEGSSIHCLEAGGCTKGVCQMSTTIPTVKVTQ